MGLRYERHGAKILRSAQWKVVRLQAKRRDGFRCVECKAPGRLEVHHVKRVKDFPELAFDLENLKTLCARCHARVTRIECGLAAELDPARAAWRDFVRALAQPLSMEKDNVAICSNFASPV